MNHSMPRGRKLRTLVLTASLTASLIVGVMPATVSAAANCPINVELHGSTTVHPVNRDFAKAAFEAVNAGTTVNLLSNGSGAGLNDLHAGTGGTDIAGSSRPLTATELGRFYPAEIGRDAFVMAVKAGATMNFISNITVAQVKGIYEGTITNWNQLNGAYPNVPIVPRARILLSGTQPDFISQFGVNSGLEINTINATGLTRLTESEDMANAAAANNFQIAYTSIANLDTPNMRALTLDGIAPTKATVLSGQYPKRRDLFVAVKQIDHPLGARLDNSDTVKADDYLNYMLSAAGQAHVNAAGFVPFNINGLPPLIIDSDINLDGFHSLGDLGQITNKWTASSACPGYTRADVNNDGFHSLGDIGGVTNKWNAPGFTEPN